VNQAILDVNLLRPSDFAIIDGIIGMEGPGPFKGTPVRVDVVLAGRNTVAVDRVALVAMGIPADRVRYLGYASYFGMGPADLSQISISGDALPMRRFARTPLPPDFTVPTVTPTSIDPQTNQAVTISVTFNQPCQRKVEVVCFHEDSPQKDLIRTVASVAQNDVGTEQFVWDGRADDGTIAPPGRYAVRIEAIDPALNALPSVATAWVNVMA
jgi:hypothetical protein